MSAKPTIFLGMPCYNGTAEVEALLAATLSSGKDFHVLFAPCSNSNTAKNFNTLWANALNYFEAGTAQLFAMLHSDCIPGPRDSWLQILYDELRDRRLDLLSVVSAIKSGQGLTSTGCDIEHGDPWRVRRFTMTEIMRLPETFEQEDTIVAGVNDAATTLVVNTGCMLIDMANPFWREADANGDLGFRFTFYDRIRKDADGDWMAHGISEDWDWSRMMAAKGMRYAATRKVLLTHMGRKGYRNDSASGAWKYDMAHPERAAKWQKTAMSEDGTPLAEVEAIA